MNYLRMNCSGVEWCHRSCTNRSMIVTLINTFPGEKDIMATAARVKARPNKAAAVRSSASSNGGVQSVGELTFEVVDAMPAQHRAGRRSGPNPYAELFNTSVESWDEETDAGGVIVVHLNTGEFLDSKDGEKSYSKELAVAKRRIREAAMKTGFGVSVGVEPAEDTLVPNEDVRVFFQAKHRRERRTSNS